MTDLQNILVGDTDSFAVGFDVLEPRGPLDAPDWGGVAIWVNGTNLCAWTRDGESREYSYSDLSEWLGWLARSWDYILHEQRLPELRAHDLPATALRASAPHGLVDAGLKLWFDRMSEWHDRHCIRAARDGGLFPNVVMRRRQGDIEFTWDNRNLPDMPPAHRFSATLDGLEYQDASIVAHVLFDSSKQLVDFLKTHRPSVAGIDLLESQIAAVASKSRASDRVALLAGLTAEGNDAVVDTEDAWQTDAASEPLLVAGGCSAPILFGSMAPTITKADVMAIASLMLSRHRSTDTDETAVIDEIADPLDVEGTPWEDGYDLASDLQDELELSRSEVLNADELAQRLGVDVVDIELSDPETRGLCFVSDTHRPTIAVNTKYPANALSAGRRFTICHELCHLIHDRDHGDELAMSSNRNWTSPPVESRANAFAAYLLMPMRLVSDIWAETRMYPLDERVRRVAEAVDVTYSTAGYQLANLRLMTYSQRISLNIPTSYA